MARTADLDRRLQLEQHRLVHENLASARAEPSNLSLCQGDLLAGTAPTDLQKLGDDVIDVRRTGSGCCG